MREDDFAVFLVKHDLESALYNLEKCDIRVPTLGEAHILIEKALKFVNEDLELRRKVNEEKREEEA